MDQLGITFVVLMSAIAMMVVKRTEKIGWWLRRLDVELLGKVSGTAASSIGRLGSFVARSRRRG